MSFCKSCGTKNNSSNKFCKNCGEILNGSKGSTERGLRKEVKRLEEEIKRLKEEKANEEVLAIEKEKQSKKKAKKENVILEEKLEKIKEEITVDIKEEVANEVTPAIKSEISKKLKNDLKKEFTIELKQETIDEIKEEFSSKFIEDIKREIKDDVSSEVSNEVKSEISKKVKNDIKKEITNEIKDDALTDIKDDVVDEIKKEVRNEVKNELSQTMELIGLSDAIKTKRKSSSSPLLLLLMIIVVAFGYFYFSYMFGPKHVASEYLDALEDNDFVSLYEYDESFDKNGFISEKMYMEYLKEKVDESGRLIDYEINSVDYSSDGKSVIVRAVVTYLKDNKEERSDFEIILYRGEKKKFVIFDTWYIKDNSTLGIKIIEDYKIYVPSGSLVTYDKVELNEKYLEKESDDLIDVYRLDVVLEDTVDLRVVLPSGIEVVKEIKPSKYYNEYRLIITDEDLAKSEKDLDGIISNSLEEIVNNAFAKENLDCLEWIDDSKDYESFSKKYELFLNKIDSLDLSFSDFEITNVEIDDIEFNNVYQYIIELKLEYSWKSNFLDEEISKNDFGFYIVYLNYEDGNYKFVDINKLPNVFVN